MTRFEYVGWGTTIAWLWPAAAYDLGVPFGAMMGVAISALVAYLRFWEPITGHKPSEWGWD